jgi:hypothetical protein
MAQVGDSLSCLNCTHCAWPRKRADTHCLCMQRYSAKLLRGAQAAAGVVTMTALAAGRTTSGTDDAATAGSSASGIGPGANAAASDNGGAGRLAATGSGARVTSAASHGADAADSMLGATGREAGPSWRWEGSQLAIDSEATAVAATHGQRRDRLVNAGTGRWPGSARRASSSTAAGGRIGMPASCSGTARSGMSDSEKPASGSRSARGLPALLSSRRSMSADCGRIRGSTASARSNVATKYPA